MQDQLAVFQSEIGFRIKNLIAVLIEERSRPGCHPPDVFDENAQDQQVVIDTLPEFLVDQILLVSPRAGHAKIVGFQVWDHLGQVITKALAIRHTFTSSKGISEQQNTSLSFVRARQLKFFIIAKAGGVAANKIPTTFVRNSGLQIWNEDTPNLGVISINLTDRYISNLRDKVKSPETYLHPHYASMISWIRKATQET